MTLDLFDRRILAALADDAGLTNVQLAEQVHLSPSQCSRRRAALEQAGVIRGYHADIDHGRLGLNILAITRITLDAHGPEAAEEFARAVTTLPEVTQAAIVTGDADYVLWIRVGSLDALAEFIQARLLPLRAVRQVRTDVVLRMLKDRAALQAAP